MKAKSVIGLLFPGDMGLAIGNVLLNNNFEVITAGKGRSAKTLQNIENSQIKDVGSLSFVVEQSDIILSVNSPNSSVHIAEQITELMSDEKRGQIYVDLNSNTPQSVKQIEELIHSKNGIFINGAVMGVAKSVGNDAVMVVSGRERGLLMNVFDGIFKLKDAGEKIESASAYKLLFSMVNKGINAVFFEAMMGASHYGILEEMNESLQVFLPGTYADLQKMTPTYPDHIARRIDEMKGLSEMQELDDLSNHISLATAKTFQIIDQKKIFLNETPKDVKDTFLLFRNGEF
ncbi:DUF1932 domain-containing protein [Chryseobacterium sp. MYb264]|uniref:NAD(P)-dependent oxidoreductase n=1 Tax=Chryseobacterium sp. MYb264 TaxID=2745153 RepID=UPI002E11D55B|nr:DUF1932 domain-containing protein [Chryseobacterium sp. MYb264]